MYGPNFSHHQHFGLLQTIYSVWWCQRFQKNRTMASLFQLVCHAYLPLSDSAEAIEAHEAIQRICRETATAEKRSRRLQFIQGCVFFLWRRQLRCRLSQLFWQRLCCHRNVSTAVSELHAAVGVRRRLLARLAAMLDEFGEPLVSTCQSDAAGLMVDFIASQSRCSSKPDTNNTLDTLRSTEPKAEKPSMREINPLSDINRFILVEVRAALFHTLRSDYTTVLADYYSAAFTAVEGGSCGAGGDAAVVDDAVATTCRLCELEVFGRLASGVIGRLICRQLSARVAAACSDGFTSDGACSQLRSWCGQLLAGWCRLLPADRLSVDDAHTLARLVDHAVQAYACRRIDQLFDMIVDYPDSRPALADLAPCLRRRQSGVRLHGRLVSRLRVAVSTRLLQPAANTDDILSAYVSAVRALRQLEPSGALAELVAAPVRHYLRARPDTVRCIVSALTRHEGAALLSDGLGVGGQPECDVSEWRAWQPYPRDAPRPGGVTGDAPGDTTSHADILSMLVSIYGTKNTFVKEYRKLLADRVLKNTDCDLDRELKYLELLKLRFGDSELHECDVMLKDLFNSRRINAQIGSTKDDQSTDSSPVNDNAENFPVTSLILSAQFWPDFREDTLLLPAPLEACLSAYTERYRLLKGNRTLLWRRQLGTVSVDVEVGSRSWHLQVSPTHAVILYHFQQREASCDQRPVTLSLLELSRLMHVPASLLRRKMALWVSHGVLSDTATVDVFQLNDGTAGGPHQTAAATFHLVDEEDTESAMASLEDQKQKSMDVFWNYIVGMLTNLESLPLDRIQAMLRIFAMDESEQCSALELRHFLDKKVKDCKLICSGGLYKLPKS